MGKFKRARKRKKTRARNGLALPERQCFQRPEGFIVCERLYGGGWTQVPHMSFDTCEECTAAIGTNKCYE
ncbi:hypothetical protein [Pedobacter ginsengiterrae]|uniref:hypothetical protein n=1 Tax=Pedobacter ginsengiterrae TaxID=871696 RepID=UPI0031D7E64C